MARELGIERIFAEVLAQKKANYVRERQAEGKQVAWWATASTTLLHSPRPM